MKLVGSMTSVDSGYVGEIKVEPDSKQKRNRSISNPKLINQSSGSLSDRIHNNPPVAPSEKTLYFRDAEYVHESILPNQLKSLALSPRNYISVNDLERPMKLSLRMLNELTEIKEKINTPYAFLSIAEITQSMDLYYHQQLKETIENSKSKKKTLTHFTEFQSKLNSNQSPVVFLSILHFQEFASNLPVNNETSRRLKNILGVLITGKLTGQFLSIQLPLNPNHLEILIAFFKEYQYESTGAVLSYMIFGKNENRLKELILIMEKWNQLDPATFLADVKMMKKKQIDRFLPPSNHQFKIEDIKRTYVMHDSILPDRIMIDYIPLRLTQFSKNNTESEFFRVLLNNILQSWPSHEMSNEQFETILDNFLRSDQLPDYLQILLGCTTVSAMQLAHSFFLDKFPAFKIESGSGMTCRFKHRDDQEKVEIFINVKSPPANCHRCITLVIYPKVHPDDPESYGIDHDKPLAEIIVPWSFRLITQKIKGKADHSILLKETHTDSFEIRSCHFCTQTNKVLENGIEKEVVTYNATEEQQIFILKTLGLPLDTSVNKEKRQFLDPKCKVINLRRSFRRKSSPLEEKITIISNPLYVNNQSDNVSKSKEK